MALKDQIRLQKYLAECGVASRRKAEEFIAAGRVSVDGKRVTDMGIKIDPTVQIIRCDKRRITRLNRPPVYILLNKPKGYVTTVSDPQGRPVVTDLLTDVKTRVFPVGRLDLDTEGALLLTNDGDLANKILHPKFETNKSYEAQVKGTPTKAKLSQLEAGIMLEGKRTWPASIRIIKQKKYVTIVRITIHEGRKRQVRKMFQAMGHPVLHLKRLAYGKLTLGTLKSGSYRFLKKNELKKIFL